MLRWSSAVIVCLAVIACGHKSNGSGGAPDASGDPGGDAGSTCSLQSCASVGATCGPIGDGCGGTIDCGTCTAPDTCGGGGTLFTCGGGSGSTTCMPKSCTGVTCG